MMLIQCLTIFIIHILVFPNKKLNEIKNNVWITPGIKTLCHHKRDLCFIITNSNDFKLKKIMNYNKKLLNIDF